MGEDMIYSFDATTLPTLSEVGGKGLSLMRMTQAGLPVPPGFTLSVAFFAPWIADLQAGPEWTAVQTAIGNKDDLIASTTALKMACAGLAWTATQDRQIADSLKTLPNDCFFAVRSSSPEEDLEGASFAGGYETILGITATALPEAIRNVFASAFDGRVFVYKQQHRFAVEEPRTAVIVQQQIAADSAGVGFSLNPLNNDYDEAVIDANWGLGESVVAGMVSPDHFVVDKVSTTIIEKQLGSKETGVWLSAGGGTEKRPGQKSAEFCLTDAQVSEITAVVKRIETLYEEPVDVEWAIAEGRLHVLQARPITAYVPLHESLQTAPGAPRHLYMDGFLTDTITMSDAVTPMSAEVASLLALLFLQWMVNVPAREMDVASMGMHPQSSRFYLDVSMYLHLMGKGERLAKVTDTFNPIIAGVFASPEIEKYRPAKAPAQVRIARLLRYLPGVLWRTRRAVTVLLGPMFRRDRFDANYAKTLKEFDEWITRPMDYSQSVADCAIEGLLQAGSTIMVSSYPAAIYYLIMTGRIRGLVDSSSAEQLALVDTVCGGIEDDMIVNMGLTIYDLSTLLPASEFDDIEALAAKLEQRSLPEAFLTRWDEFVRRYGCRGPLEMELANPKYGEAPQLALRQMASVAGAGNEFNPHDMAREQAERRVQAHNKLLEILPPRKARRLKKYYAACSRHAAAREMFKHHIMQVYERVRKLLLHRADEFVRAGRLEQRDQIFELAIDDVDRAAQDPGFDLRATVDERGAFYRKLKSHVRHFPMYIDSRGRILRAPAKYEEGALVGVAVAPGVARGPVKVLNDPFEKEVQPGDVLVAVTTDPGWTPLFINAAAVILEIGGPLQHGALVAREYGKPCVSSIQDVVTQFEDGQIVEVDGDAGVIRILES
ncbi:MAG: PEP/pyruvate-binding domain-containing protein [Dehalococcoidia bacterium]